MKNNQHHTGMPMYKSKDLIFWVWLQVATQTVPQDERSLFIVDLKCAMSNRKET